MDSVYLVVVIGAVAAGCVQGILGFAFGLVAMSFWVWVLELRLAATLAVFGALVGQILAAVTARRGFDLKLLAPFVIGGLAGVPIGVLLLPHLDMDAFRAILGGLLVLWCTLRGFQKDTQRAVIQNFNLSILLVTMGTYLATGIVTADMLPFFAVVAPAMLVPTLLGAKFCIGMSEARFRQVVLGLLTVSGLALLYSVVPNLLLR